MLDVPVDFRIGIAHTIQEGEQRKVWRRCNRKSLVDVVAKLQQDCAE